MIHCADVLEWEGEQYHAMLCDPPYELGFMGKRWDGTGIAFQPETWEHLAQFLLPGAFGMAFSSSRTWHRLAVAIEDAGLIIHPSIFGWNYASGFPKASRVNWRCKCGDRKEVSQHSLRSVREGDIPQARATGSTEGEVLQQSLSEQGISSNGAMPKQGDEGQQESGMEGGSDLLSQARQLSADQVCALSPGASPDGSQGRICDGASPCDGTDNQTPPSQKRGGASQGSQPSKQRARQPGVVSEQSCPQDGGGWPICDGCGKPIVDEDAWEGHRYGLQALKPALEPIIVFQKPYGQECGECRGTGVQLTDERLTNDEWLIWAAANPCKRCKGTGYVSCKPIDCITEHGAGALNIDGGRIGAAGESFHRPCNHTGLHEGWDRPWRHDEDGLARERTRRDESERKAESQGRWPANFCLTHHPECGEDCHPECPVRKLGEQSGERTNTRHMSYKRSGGDFIDGIPNQEEKRWFVQETGTAARFFHQSSWELENADPVMYCPKAARKERDAGLEGFELGPPPASARSKPAEGRKNALGEPRRNSHPTVKPIALARWLATLLLPPKEYAPRRILVPFAGVGSEMIGAHLAGWEEVTGIEQDKEYCEIAEARWEHWTRQGRLV